MNSPRFEVEHLQSVLLTIPQELSDAMLAASASLRGGEGKRSNSDKSQEIPELKQFPNYDFMKCDARD